MKRDSLMLFMKRILEQGSDAKSLHALDQLKEILTMQGESPETIGLISKTIESIYEARTAAKETAFTEEDLKIAFRRAENRKRREAEMARRGRC